MNEFTIVLAERLCILGNVEDEQIANDNKLHERFYFGKPGCDNRFAHELLRAGFEVINPCVQIKSYHLHNTCIRRVGSADRIPSPYLYLDHTLLEFNQAARTT